MKVDKLTRQLWRDFTGRKTAISSLDEHISAAMDWLCRAQDSQGDGGVSLRYSLVYGWDRSYPETTGYIIPTFFYYAALAEDEGFRNRALRMADWELSIQNPDGSFNGGALGSGYSGFAFDTGQVIFGLVAAHRATGAQKYLDGAIRAGRWLESAQSADGSWIRGGFHGIAHAYYSRVAWALAELGKYAGERSFLVAASRNIDWVLRQQNGNGWFAQAGFTVPAHLEPYTHTIAYTIEGVLEAGSLLDRQDCLSAATASADALEKILNADGCYAGTYDAQWRSSAKYSCLTGNAQIAWVFLRLFQQCGEKKYLASAQRLNRFLCERQDMTAATQVRGAIAGSYPLWGGYQRLAYPNWATKFFVDALLLEKRITEAAGTDERRIPE